MTLPFDLPVATEEVTAAVEMGSFAAAALPRLAQLGSPGWQLHYEFDVYGSPAPQGSKKGFRHPHTDRVIVVEQQNKRVKDWRGDVKAIAEQLRATRDRKLDGPLALGVVFSLPKPASKPTWWPQGEPWRRTMQWRPASSPDLDKLLRSTMDALTAADVWKDDARVTEFPRVAKVFVDEDRDALSVPGARICIWTVPSW